MESVEEALLTLLIELDGVPQSPRHHPEGDALYHSLQVFDHALVESDDVELQAAALFHDLGKAWGTPGHAERGASLLRGLLSERVVWLVAHHMDLLHAPRRTRRRLRHHPRRLHDLQTLRRWDLSGRSPWAAVMEPEAAVAIITSTPWPEPGIPTPSSARCHPCHEERE